MILIIFKKQNRKITISEKLIYFIESWNLIMGHFALMTLRFFMNANK